MTTATLNPALQEYRQKINDAVAYIKARVTALPEVGVILGSGLGELADEVEGKLAIPYGDIPHFPVSTAPGHAGNLVFGKLGGKNVVLQQGRFHTYEGYSPKETAFPVRVMRALGAETLIVTCATGGLNHRFQAGDLMVISDHINMTFTNPLMGPNDPELGTRFPVMFDAYRPELRQLAHEVAVQLGVRLQEGIYAGITGPAYLTRAELRMLISLGADSVGMSTVNEVIAAVHGGMKVLGIGTITDMAIPDSHHHADEQEVLEIARRTGPKFRNVIRGVLERM